MHGYGTFLAELFLSFVNLTDEIDESLSRFWNTLFWPIGKLKLPKKKSKFKPYLFFIIKEIVTHQSFGLPYGSG
jgi:hypothetical protein